MTSPRYTIDVYSNNLPFPVVDTRQEHLSERLFEQLVVSSQSIHICTINAEIAHHLLTDLRSQHALKSVNYFIPDGVGVMWAFKYLFGVDAGKLPGIEFSERLLAECNKLQYSVALYGATPDRVLLARRYIERKYNDLAVTASLDGYSEPEDIIRFILKCKEERVRLVLVALGHPRQDEFIAKHLDSFSAIWVGVGGSFDVWSGAKKRAPKFLSLIGIEWLYRIIQDPSLHRVKRSLDLPAFCLSIIVYRLKLLFK